MAMGGGFVVRNRPAGYKPAGWAPAPAAKAAATTHEFTPSEALRTPTFYFMWVAYALGTVAGFMAISQLVPFAKGVGLAAIAGTAIVVGPVGNPPARLLSGFLSDATSPLHAPRPITLV